jgi:flagellar secretion chaperone FliS
MKMWRNAYDTYLEDRILSADPVELVHMLYQAASTAIADARRHLAEGRIKERATAISKACDILLELNTSLDYERGGALSERLANLYGYMHRRLIEANFRQSDDCLAEVGSLLATLEEAWEAVRQDAHRTEQKESSWIPAMAQEQEFAQSSNAWSF